MPASFDCLVLGLGGVGSAALAALADRGVRVLGIDQYRPPHERGSSHGETRVIRRAYYEHPDYIPLVERAYGLWRQLEEATGRTLLTRTGLALVGPLGGEALAGTLSAAAVHRLPIAEIPREEARAQFPHFQIAENESVVYEEDAGFLHVEDCVQAHLDVAAARGAETRFDESVLSWSARESEVRVTTDRSEYSAERLIVTAGAWAGRVLVDWNVPLIVRRKILQWHPVPPDKAGAFSNGPIFLFDQPAGVFYGFPSVDGRTVKVGEHTGGLEAPDPSHLDRELHESDVGPIARFLARSLPGVDPVPERHTACMYTMTPDGNFIVDRHPRHSNVAVAAGLSGHGFKFAPVLAAALADLSLEGETDLPIDFLSLSRFAG